MLLILFGMVVSTQPWFCHSHAHTRSYGTYEFRFNVPIPYVDCDELKIKFAVAGDLPATAIGEIFSVTNTNESGIVDMDTRFVRQTLRLVRLQRFVIDEQSESSFRVEYLKAVPRKSVAGLKRRCYLADSSAPFSGESAEYWGSQADDGEDNLVDNNNLDSFELILPDTTITPAEESTEPEQSSTIWDIRNSIEAASESKFGEDSTQTSASEETDTIGSEWTRFDDARRRISVTPEVVSNYILTQNGDVVYRDMVQYVQSALSRLTIPFASNVALRLIDVNGTVFGASGAPRKNEEGFRFDDGFGSADGTSQEASDVDDGFESADETSQETIHIGDWFEPVYVTSREASDFDDGFGPADVSSREVPNKISSGESVENGGGSAENDYEPMEDTDCVEDQEAYEETGQEDSNEYSNDESAQESEQTSTQGSRQGSTENAEQGSKQKSKQGSKQKSKQGSTEKSKQGSTEKSKQGSTEKSKQGSKQGSKGNSKQGSKQGSKENSKQGSKQNSKQGSTEKSKQGSKQESKQGSKGNSNQGSKQGSKENSKQGSKQNSKQGSKGNSKQGSNEKSKQGSNENSKQGSKQNSKQGSKENSKQGSKQNSKRGSKQKCKERSAGKPNKGTFLSIDRVSENKFRITPYHVLPDSQNAVFIQETLPKPSPLESPEILPGDPSTFDPETNPVDPNDPDASFVLIKKIPPTLGSGLCLSGDDTVQTMEGLSTIRNLKPDDQVLVPATLAGSICNRFEKIVYFLHHDHSVCTDFVRITTPTGNITLTGRHLIPILPCDAARYMVPGNDIFNAYSKPADNVQVGKCLINKDFELISITDVRRVRKCGIYAPVTESGKLLVNGFQVSSYAEVADHRIAHRALTLVHRLGTAIADWSATLSAIADWSVPQRLQKFVLWDSQFLFNLMHQMNI